MMKVPPIPCTIKTDDLLSCSFLLPPDKNGENHCATVIQKVLDAQSEELARPEKLNFLIKLDINEEAEELIAYNELMDYIQQDPSQVHSGVMNISSSEQSLLTRDLCRKMTWEVTYEPLGIISKVDPIECATHAMKINLLDVPGWRHLRKYVKTSKRFIKATKQSRLEITESLNQVQVWISRPQKL